MEDNIYANVNSLDQKKVGQLETQDTSIKKKTPDDQAVDRIGGRCSRLAAVCLGVLCVLLLIIIAVLFVHNVKEKEAKDQTISSLNVNFTAERETLLSSIGNLTEERDQLKNSNKDLTEERDQLKSSNKDMTEKINKGLKNPKHIVNDMASWRKFESSYFYISTEKKMWWDARVDCKERGSDLVIINSRGEQEFNKKLAEGKNAWIGLTDAETEGVWKWVDRSPLTIKYWDYKQPDNDGGAEDCAFFRVGSSTLQTWHDLPCDQKISWICEATYS